MKIAITLFITFFAAATSAIAQPPTPSPTQQPILDTISTPPIEDEKFPPERDVANFAKQLSPYVRPDAATRRKRFINSLVGPVTLGRHVVTAGISTWRNSPEEWGDNWEGFGRRVASGLGRNAIKQTTVFGLDEAFKLDSHFYRSQNKSVGARIRNALISPVTARDKNGKRVVGFPRLLGTYASGIIAYETWYPERYSWKDGVRSGTISLGFNAAFNLFKEFVWKK